jgi:hypothetical protein
MLSIIFLFADSDWRLVLPGDSSSLLVVVTLAVSAAEVVGLGSGGAGFFRVKG